MGLKSPAEYVQSLRDGRVTFWDGERINEVTVHPRFKIPIANTAADDAYDHPERAAGLACETEEGDRAHRIFQIPRTEADLAARVQLMHSIAAGVH